jgi:uncharacterized protein
MIDKPLFDDNHSPGCRSCQDGKWLCIYLTYLCPAHCAFCPAPFKNDQIITAFGNDKNIISDYLNENDFNGIAFSGGDPLVQFERLTDWLSFFKTKLPGYYFWAYTSGLTVTQSQLKILSENGLDELRFNIAATGYHSDVIFQKIEYAVKVFPAVAVEIPSITEDFNQLIRILPVLDRIGVKYLNLHEFIFTGKEIDPNDCGEFLLNKISRLKYSLSSLNNTMRITDFCKENKLKIKINNCSLLKKEEQMRQRRLKMGTVFKNEKDILNKEGIIKRKLVLKGKFSKKEIIDRIRQNGLLKFMTEETTTGQTGEEFTLIELDLLPPLSLDDCYQMLDIRMID